MHYYQMLEILERNKSFDKFGLFNKSGDGGDSLYFFGNSEAMRGLCEEPKPASFEFMLQRYVFGIDYVRHPDPSMWYSNPLNVSCDQLNAVINGALANQSKKTMLHIAKGFIKRYGFAPNIYPNWCKKGDKDYQKKIPDLIRPAMIRKILTGLYGWWMWPLYNLLDAHLLVDLLLRKFNKWDYDAQGCIDYFLYDKYCPTPVSKLALYFYLKTDFLVYVEKYFADGGAPRIDLLIKYYKERNYGSNTKI